MRRFAPVFLPVAVLLAVIVFFQQSAGEPLPTVVISSIRELHRAEVQYRSIYGHYADSKQLGEVAATRTAAALADGYRLELKLTSTGYEITAAPLKGRRWSYCSDEQMSLRYGNDSRVCRQQQPAVKKFPIR